MILKLACKTGWFIYVEILKQLGYSDESIKALIDNHVIGPVEWNKYKPLKL